MKEENATNRKMDFTTKPEFTEMKKSMDIFMGIWANVTGKTMAFKKI